MCRPMLLARAVGLPRPTVDASRTARDAVMADGSSPAIKQGGMDRRRIRIGLSASGWAEAAEFRPWAGEEACHPLEEAVGHRRWVPEV